MRNPASGALKSRYQSEDTGDTYARHADKDGVQKPDGEQSAENYGESPKSLLFGHSATLCDLIYLVLNEAVVDETEAEEL